MMPIIRETETEYGDGQEQSQNGEWTGPDFSVIIGAPDLTTLIKRPSTATSREYRDKAASAFKAYTFGALQAHQYADAATVLWHGPGAATAIGDLCDANEHVAQAVDLLTSPNSPIAACLLAIIPLVAQLTRNHEKEIRDIPSKFNMSREARQVRRAAKAAQAPPVPPRFTFKLFGRSFALRMNMRIPLLKGFLAGVRGGTTDPNILAFQVFNNPDVIKAFEKNGIIIQPGKQADG
jgi:hypothetical protein